MSGDDLLYVAWRLDTEDDGPVVVHRNGHDGSAATDTYELNTPSDWGTLPPRTARILEDEDRRRGEWAA